MSDVFISYAREDRGKAKALAELFQQQDWPVWWDRNIPPGRSFDEVIEKALGVAKCVVVLWSKIPHHQTGSKAKREKRCSGKFWFRCAFTPRMCRWEFRRLQTVDLSDWKHGAGHPELNGLLDAVAANIKGVVRRPLSKGSQRKLVKPVLTVLAIVALLAAGFGFLQVRGRRGLQQLSSQPLRGGSYQRRSCNSCLLDTKSVPPRGRVIRSNRSSTQRPQKF
jgi:hypothetical protein